MKALEWATSAQESPVFFPASGARLFGILTSPSSAPRGTAVVVLSGGGTPLATSVNRLSVRLCRRLAGDGFHSFRFDYHGVGESFGQSTRFHLGQPFTTDVIGAVDWLRAQGIERFALVGSCFGARTALSAAATMQGLLGTALVCPPVRDFEMGEKATTRIAAQLSAWSFIRRAAISKRISNLLRPDVRRRYARLGAEKVRRLVGGLDETSREARYGLSPQFLGPMRSLAERSVPVTLIYGETDDFLTDFEKARPGELDEVLETFGTALSVTHLPGAIHGFRDLETQDQVLDLVSEWLDRQAVGQSAGHLADGAGRTSVEQKEAAP